MKLGACAAEVVHLQLFSPSDIEKSKINYQNNKSAYCFLQFDIFVCEDLQGICAKINSKTFDISFFHFFELQHPYKIQNNYNKK